MLNLLINTLYLLAMINPISKVALLTASAEEQNRDFSVLILQSTMAAAGILFGAMVVGDFTLRLIFRVELYSLQVAGGIVVLWAGMNALRRGRFFECDPLSRIQDVALVPLACPMTAGPATIAACIGLSAQEGLPGATAAMVIALAINHAVMMLSKPIGRTLEKHNILGAIIRVTGLIVMTIGTQMVLAGLADWFGGLS